MHFKKIFNKFKQFLKPTGFIGIFNPVITGNESTILKFVMNIDQGKFHKTYNEYLQLFKDCNLKIVDQKITDVKDPLLNYNNYAAFKLGVE